MVLVTYMATAFGFTCTLHYCGGKFKEICFTDDTEKNCCGIKEKSSHCCQDQVISASFKGSHAPSYHTFSPKVFCAMLPVQAHQSAPYSLPVCNGYGPVNNYRPPPLISAVPRYLMQCSIRV
jgi:hypothetical protein